MARRAKSQARRNGGGIPGWIWLLVGLLAGLVAAGMLLLGGRLGRDDARVPRPDPGARAPAAAETPAEEVAPEPRKPKYDFYDVLRDKEVEIPDAELATRAAAEARTPAAADSVRYLLQAGAFRAAGDAEALKARIALAGEVARVESAEIQGGTIHRVRLGPYPNASALARAKDALASHGIEAMAIRAQ